jgi:hypothetical protein
MGQAFLMVAVFALIALGAWRSRGWLPFQRKEARDFDFDKAPFSIQKLTGAIHIKNSVLVLRPAMFQSEFLDSDLHEHTTSARYFPLEGGIGHRFLISFRDSVFEKVHLRLSFENERLGCVDFSWGPQVSTPEWTEERIQADVARYRTFLIQEQGPISGFPCEFLWGTVYAAKDEKAGAPATGIRYKGFEFRAKAR